MIRYEERTPSRRSWLILLGVCAASWAGLAMTEGGWLLATILVGMFAVITGLTMWSTGFYGNIRLTDDELRVGRARVKLADLYPCRVSQPGEKLQGRLIGGAYGNTLGTGAVALVPSDGEPLLIATRDAAALRTALEAAVAAQHAKA